MVDSLDLCGMRCPLPLLKTRQALRQLARHALLRIVLDDSGSALDVPRWLLANGHQVVQQHQEGDRHVLLIRCGN